MSEDFAKVIEIYQPSEEDLKEKDDHPDQSRDPYSDLDLLPLAILCPQLGKVIVCKSNDPDGPRSCC